MTSRVLCIVAICALACGDDDTSSDASVGTDSAADSSAPPSGLLLYMEPHPDGNSFACSTCHALSEPAPDGNIRPGHPIGDAAARPSFKNGQFTDLRDAVNTCRSEWMLAPDFEADDARWLALEGYLQEQAPDSAPPLEFQTAAIPTDLSGGDVEEGRAIFNGRCIVCHGENATGTERAPALQGEFLEPDYIAERVRTSGTVGSRVYVGLTGGRMPFWAEDRLSNEQLINVIAFVDQNDPEDTTMNMMGELRDCASTHANIGQTAELMTRFHGVTGTATIQDDCTIRIDGFSFDGQGIDVRFYGGSGGVFQSGITMSEDLRRAEGYTNETVFAQLPESNTFDDIDSISVWCVPVGASFGDGLFSN
jgi:mono/diheme cytochrome c family protein